MKKVIADTSALISLALSGHLARVCEALEIHIPTAVCIELDEIAAYSDKISNAAREYVVLIHQKKIRLHDTGNLEKKSRFMNSKIDLGEAACFDLAIKEGIRDILLDDVAAANALQGMAFSAKVSIKLSAAALVGLHNRKIITKNELRKGLTAMIQNRNWGKSTMENAIRKYFD